MYKTIISLIISASMLNISYAQSGFQLPTTTHDIPGIAVVSRAQWGADETLKYSSQPVYQQILKNKAKNAEYISKLRASNSPKLKPIQAKQEKANLANLHIKTKYPQERYANQTIGYEMGKTLRWPFAYQTKSKFIIHHTVTDTKKLLTKQDIYTYLQKVQKLHSLTRGWGDIGYNYLIGPDGTVYEGRAGGEGVVGAHATRNNFEAIGIALIGNFEIEKVPTAQVESLIKLITQLSVKYQINPKETKIYHRDSDVEPYIQDLSYPGIVGHTHVGKTQCPGKDLLDQMNYIRYRVYANLNLTEGVIVDYRQTIGYSGSTWTISGVISNDIPHQCILDSNQLQIDQCRYVGSDLQLTVSAKSGSKIYQTQSDILRLVYPDGRQSRIMIRYQTLPSPAQQLQMLRQSYITRHKIVASTKPIEKIVGKIAQSDIQALSTKDVSILLYNSSLTAKHTISCDQGCILSDQYGQSQTVKGALTLWKTDTDIKIQYSSGIVQTWSMVKIRALGKRVNLTNVQYTRSYLGTLTFAPAQIKTIAGKILNTIAITNQLSFRNYLYGIAEEDNQQHREKLKVMAILVKNYALFYLHPSNIHTSIIPGQGYDFIDDPRIFQKYAGYNFQKDHPKRVATIDETRNQRILHNQKLVLLPYYHCNAGFTRSAREKFGRSDTDYLPSVLDPDGICPDGLFQGHGVGLSGRGAQTQANRGKTYQEIIQFYYPQTNLVSN